MAGDAKATVTGDDRVVPHNLAAVRFALDWEARGGELLTDGHGILLGPKALITDDDRQAVRRWRQHLRAIASYSESVQ